MLIGDQYVRQARTPEANLMKMFAIKGEVLEDLQKARVEMMVAGKANQFGYVSDVDAWAKLDKSRRLAAIGLIMADVHNGRPLQRAKYPLPTLRAALTVDTSEMIELFQQTIGELSAPMRFGEMLLRRENFPGGQGANSTRVGSAVAEDYIYEKKVSNVETKRVSSMWKYATYEPVQRAVQVDMDRYDLNKLPWDEFGRQMRLLAMGAARTINLVVYKAFLLAYGAGTRPFPDLEDIGGTDASALQTINSSTTSPYTSITRTAGDILYYDYLHACKCIRRRPNALAPKYIVVAPAQWERMEYWNVSQKIAFANVMGRDESFTTEPGFDGRRIPITVIVDDDLADNTALTLPSSLNVALYVGPADFVGVLGVEEDPSILQDFDASRNTQEIIGRMANDAVISNYNSWVFQYNLLTSY